LKGLGTKLLSVAYDHRWAGVGISVIALISVSSLLVWLSLGHIFKQTQSDLVNMLSATVQTTHESLILWEEEQITDITYWAESDSVTMMVHELLSLQRDAAVLKQSAVQSRLRELLEPVVRKNKLMGYFVISPDHLSIASMRDSNIGSVNLLNRYAGFLDGIFTGESKVSLPFYSDVALKDSAGETRDHLPTMFVAAPVRNAAGVIVAALAFRIDPALQFTRLVQLSRVGASGEIYLFDKTGRLISESRFEKQLRSQGILEVDEHAMLNIAIRVPDRDSVGSGQINMMRKGQPLTRMALSAIQGKTEQNVEGYFDYRGILVIGSWTWNDKMGYGIAAEMDVSEAYASYDNTRLLVIGTLILTTLIALILGAVILIVYRRNEMKLAEKEQRLSSIINNLADGLITIDSKGIIHSFNPAAEHMFAYRCDEVIGENVNILMPEPFHSQHDRYLRHFIKTHEKKAIGINREVVAKRKDGSVFAITLAVSSIKLGEERLFTGLIKDISDRKLAEEELTNKNRELAMRAEYDKSFAECISVIAGTYDRDKALHDVLSILAKNHAFPVAAIYLIDAPNKQLVCAASYGAPASFKKQMKMHEGLVGQAVKERQILVLDSLNLQDGLSVETGLLSFSPVAVAVSPILYGDEVLGVLELVSSKKMIDLDRYFIERLSIQLGVAFNSFGQYVHLQEISAQLREHSEEIKKKNRALESASQMKSEFLANMSHELRTPLNAIIGFSELIKDGAIGALNDDQSEYMQEIYASGHHLLELINEILDLSKIEAGKMTLDLCEVIISDLLENSLSIIREKALNHGVSLQTKISEDIGCCMVDMRKLKQILYNLLSNAVKFTPVGGSISLQARIVCGDRAELKDCPASDSFLEIMVCDSGIGIAEQDYEKIFRPFEQIDGSLSRNYEGTGLGLILVKSMAELHGGAVAVESELDKGSTFTVWIPYKPSDLEIELAMKGSSEKSTVVDLNSKETSLALIVEDDYASAELIRLKLEKYGFQTERAATAEGALHWLETHQPDLILLDVILPLTSGLEFIEKLKQDHLDHDVAVIVVSALARDYQAEFFKLGVTAIVQKPVDERVLDDELIKQGFRALKKDGKSIHN